MQIEPFLPPGDAVGLRVPEAVEASWCDELRDELSRRGFAATGARYPRGYRDNDRLAFDDATLAARLYARLLPALPAELERAGERWQLVGLNERFRACRYRAGQSFCIHRDGPCVPDEETRSWLTVQLYLDDASGAAGMSGGRTRFYADREGRREQAAIAPRRGTVIVFDHGAWHDGEAVTAGEKHVLRSDAMYRRVARPPAAESAALLGRHRGYAWRVVACRDGSIASSGRDGTVRRWRAGVEPELHQVASSSVTALVEDAAGQLWWGTRDGAVGRLPALGSAPFASGLGAILDAVALPRGVAFSTSRGEVFICDAGEAAPRRLHAHAGWAWALACRDGALFSAGEDGEVISHLRAPASAAPPRARVLASLHQPVRALAVRGDGALLAGCSDGLLYSLVGSRRELLRGHRAAVTGLAVAPDGQRWASSSEDGTILLWRGDGLVAEVSRRADFVTGVAFAENGALVSSGYDGVVLRETLEAQAFRC